MSKFNPYSNLKPCWCILVINPILKKRIGMIAYVGPYIAQPLLNETKCVIQNLEVFQITDTKYFMEITLLNNGDNTIISYDIRSSGWVLSRDSIIISGNHTTDEFTVSNIDEEFLEVLITTTHDSAICTGVINI